MAGATRACEINKTVMTARVRAELAARSATDREEWADQVVRGFIMSARELLDLTPEEMRSRGLGDLTLAAACARTRLHEIGGAA